MSATNARRKPSVGIVGVGAMGLGVAARLLALGFAVTVRDIRPERERLARRLRAKVAPSPAALASGCDLVITLVVDAAQTRTVMFGKDGIVKGMRPGGVVLLCSTVAPPFSAASARRLAAHGIRMLDTPLSGGPLRARTGTLSMMVAGERSVRARAAPVLRAMADRRFEFGERAGSGAAAKIVNNLLAGVTLAAGAEALALAARLGLPCERVLDLVAASSGQSWVVEDRMRRAIRGDYRLRAAPTMLAKDLGIAIETARGQRFPAPLASVARRIFRDTIALGHADEDDAAVLKRYARRAGMRVPLSASASTRRWKSSRPKARSS